MSDHPGPEPPIIIAEVVPEPLWREIPPRRPPRRRVVLPLVLFVATCLSTLLAGLDQVGIPNDPRYEPLEALAIGFLNALRYALPVMTILIFHEMGHFLQARRYGVHASYPYFIPMPLSPIGTFGAVIAMDARMGHRRALFDIGITGPLAGLVPTIIFCIIGLQLSVPVPFNPADGTRVWGTPLLFNVLAHWFGPPVPDGFIIEPDPMAFAGWVGLLITSLNLIPIGQLDGGHILYALLRDRAAQVASLLLLLAVAATAWQSYEQHQISPWILMVFLLVLMGPVHPPTADDQEPLGVGRCILGWLTLAFIFVGFTPNPIPLEQ